MKQAIIIFFFTCFCFSCKKNKNEDCDHFDVQITTSIDTTNNRDTVIVRDYKTPYPEIIDYIAFDYLFINNNINIYLRGGSIEYAYLPDIYLPYNDKLLIAFQDGQKIDSTLKYNYVTSYLLYNGYPPEHTSDSLFMGKGDKYIGFRKRIGSWDSGQARYGWIKVNLSNNGRIFRILNGALNKNLNQPIFAGKCN